MGGGGWGGGGGGARPKPRERETEGRTATNNRPLVATQAGTFTVANLYYAQPILNVISRDFGVSYERAASVATLSQAGYAAGLLFVCPLGDKVRRRPFILGLVWLTATMVCFSAFSPHVLPLLPARPALLTLGPVARAVPSWPSRSSAVLGTSRSPSPGPREVPADSDGSIR